MIPLGFGFNENQRHQNCISQDASVTGFKRKVRNPGPEDHIRLHFFEPGLRTFLTYSSLLYSPLYPVDAAYIGDMFITIGTLIYTNQNI